MEIKMQSFVSMAIYLFQLLWNKWSSHKIYHVYTHDNLQTYKTIRSAKELLILHAAFYPKYFGDKGNCSTSITTSLSANRSLKVYIIFTDYTSAWFEEFSRVLRSKLTPEQLKTIFISNEEECRALKKNFKDRIIICRSNKLPLAPMIVADNNLFIGHYAHSTIPAPEGLWLHIKNKRIAKFFHDIHTGDVATENIAFQQMSPKDRAIVRYLEECSNIIKESTT